MLDLDLECLPQWRYCQIPRGQKGPRYANWVNQPRTLDQIDAAGNIGVLLGPVSGGLMTVDFDGVTAWQWWDENIGTAIPDTVAWSSLRPGRCQMAFQVPEELWPHLRTRKIALADGEGFEFRWQGGQSVVPPSLHPMTGEPYEWILAPRHTNIAETPIELLEAWLRDDEPQTEHEPAPQGDIAHVDDDTFETLRAALSVIKNHHPRLQYDDWMRVTFAVAQTIGDGAAEIVMLEFWSEERPGEYRRMLRSRDPSRSPGLGSLVYRARQLDPAFRPQETITEHTPTTKIRKLLRGSQ